MKRAVPTALPQTPQANVLEIRDLQIRDRSGRALVCGVDLDLAAGASVGIVGESGSGKTLTARAALGLPPLGVGLEAQRMMLAGVDVYASSAKVRRSVLGTRVGYVPQNTLSYLQPSLRVRTQITDGYLTWHPHRTRKEALGRAASLLASVGIEEPERVLASYPAELSGGQRQRVNIAMALMGDPVLIVADEPTAALDSVTAEQVSRLFASLARDRGVALLMVSHDLSLIRSTCENVCVMYAGRIVEQGSSATVLQDARHPYTRGLKEAIPRLVPAHARGNRLSGIAGSMPVDGRDAQACVFAPRCPYAVDACAHGVPPLAPLHCQSAHAVQTDDAAQEHRVACLRAHELDEEGTR